MFHLLYIRRRSRRVRDLEPIFGIDPSEALISVELSKMASLQKPQMSSRQARGSIAYLTDTNLQNAIVEVRKFNPFLAMIFLWRSVVPRPIGCTNMKR